MDALYPRWKRALLEGDAAANLAGNVRAALVDADTGGGGTYVYDPTHEFLSDLSGIIGTPVPLFTMTYVDGVFDADDVLFPAVPVGPDATAIVFYTWTGDPATSRLVFYLESVTGFPYTPTGSNYEVDWDAAGIFSL